LIIASSEHIIHRSIALSKEHILSDHIIAIFILARHHQV